MNRSLIFKKRPIYGIYKRIFASLLVELILFKNREYYEIGVNFFTNQNKEGVKVI